MESGGARAPAFGQTEINWDKLDKTKFYVVGAGLFTGITVALYPVSVVKTRLQVASKDVAERNAFSVVRSILKADGMPGLYRGFGTVITGAIPARIIFLTALETTKVAAFRMVEPLNFSEPSKAAIANGIAGMFGSLCAQAVFVPVDVVSQKLMVQGYSGYATYNGGIDVFRKVVKADGIRGLYRGFGLSAATYAPSSAVWWASYGSSQRLFWSLLGYGSDYKDPPRLRDIVCVQAAGGVVAGAAASCITTPLDTIKTRLQVQAMGVIIKILQDFVDIVCVQAAGGVVAGAAAYCFTTPLDTIKTRLQVHVTGQEKRHNTAQVIKKLIADEGWKGLYRGLGPRFFSMSAWGTSMIVGYEYLKRVCMKD